MFSSGFAGSGATPGPKSEKPNRPLVSPMNFVNAALSGMAATRFRSSCSALSSRASTASSFMKLRYMAPSGVVAGAFSMIARI